MDLIHDIYLSKVDKLFDKSYRKQVSVKSEIDSYHQFLKYEKKINKSLVYDIKIYDKNYIECSIPLKNSNVFFKTVINHLNLNPETYAIVTLYYFLLNHI